MALADHQALIASLVPDAADGLTQGDRDQALAAAVARYSQDRPRELYETVAVVLPSNFLQLPAAWEPGFSKIARIEHPLGESPPRYLSAEAWELTRTALGQRIWVEELPAAGAEFGILFTAAHQVDGGADTVPQTDRVAVACFAASLLCEQLASLAAGQGHPTIDADAVDWRSKSGEFAARARKFAERYYHHLGLEPKRNVAAGVVVAPRERDSAGRRRLFKGPL